MRGYKLSVWPKYAICCFWQSDPKTFKLFMFSFWNSKLNCAYQKIQNGLKHLFFIKVKKKIWFLREKIWGKMPISEHSAYFLFLKNTPILVADWGLTGFITFFFYAFPYCLHGIIALIVKSIIYTQLYESTDYFVNSDILHSLFLGLF